MTGLEPKSQYYIFLCIHRVLYFNLTDGTMGQRESQIGLLIGSTLIRQLKQWPYSALCSEVKTSCNRPYVRPAKHDYHATEFARALSLVAGMWGS